MLLEFIISFVGKDYYSLAYHLNNGYTKLSHLHNNNFYSEFPSLNIGLSCLCIWTHGNECLMLSRKPDICNLCV